MLLLLAKVMCPHASVLCLLNVPIELDWQTHTNLSKGSDLETGKQSKHCVHLLGCSLDPGHDCPSTTVIVAMVVVVAN